MHAYNTQSPGQKPFRYAAETDAGARECQS